MYKYSNGVCREYVVDDAARDIAALNKRIVELEKTVASLLGQLDKIINSTKK